MHFEFLNESQNGIFLFLEDVVLKFHLGFELGLLCFQFCYLLPELVLAIDGAVDHFLHFAVALELSLEGFESFGAELVFAFEVLSFLLALKIFLLELVVGSIAYSYFQT